MNSSAYQRTSGYGLLFTTLAMSQMSGTKMSALQTIVPCDVHILKNSFYKLWIEITAVGNRTLNAIR